ncbi:MAG TPA: hypothetical protein IGS40_21590 [Trichormus sp. M33_DOE_039]|nr:hypothetical protein [Trichormus sp. M33_DOE_039]
MKQEGKVFSNPKYLQNSFSIIFPRKPSIRKNVFDFEVKLENSYIQPQVISIPDDINPDMPRMIFTSKHGHSQIIISQVNFVLNVNYSTDWQCDISKCQTYLLEKVSTLFDLLNIIEEKCPYFCGLSTIVQIPSQNEDDKKVISHIYNLFSKESSPSKEETNSDIYEFQIKTAKIIEDKFFSNITVSNYRSWKTITESELILKLPNESIVESGIQIIGDFNDRYTFNESESYCSNENTAKRIIELGLSQIHEIVNRVTRS